MKDKFFFYSFICFLVLFIIVMSISSIVDKENKKVVIINNVKETVKIDDKDIDIIYYQGNELDLEISYGNIYDKELEITNHNEEDVVYSLKIDECDLSNDDITYDLYVADYSKNYIKMVDNVSLSKDANLVYNLVIKGHSINYVKISFKSNYEKEVSNIKGVLKITPNLSSFELFNNTVKNINDALDNKVNSLNGITEKGYYIINIDNLTFMNDADVKGYILVDASDISDIKYVYTIYNYSYMIKNSNYSNLLLLNVDNNYVSSINEGTICNQYDTRVKCSNFSSLPKNSIDNKKKFYNDSKIIINTFMEEYDKEDDRTYIYDIKNDISNNTNIEGYILKNNNNMFLYFKDSLFMISGYNFTKLGEYNIKSNTIRSYVETAWNISASDKRKVCSFSGYSECYDKEGNLI